MKTQTRTLSLILCIALAAAVSVGLSYVYAAWANPASTPPACTTSIPCDSPVTALVTDQIKPSGLSVDTFIATQNAKFDQRTFFRGTIKGGAPLSPNPQLTIGGLAGTAPNDVITDVNGDVRSQGTLSSDELIAAAGSGTRLCADGVGHVVYCPLYVYTGQQIIGGNTSLDISLVTIEIDGQQVVFPMPYPIAPGSSGSQFWANSPTSASPVSVYVEWSSHINGQHISVIDTNGAIQCELVGNGDPTPYVTFPNVDMTGPDPLYILADDGFC